ICGIKQNNVGKEVLSKIATINLPEFQKHQNILTLKGLSPNTVRTYSIEFAQLLYVLKALPSSGLSSIRHNVTCWRSSVRCVSCRCQLKYVVKNMILKYVQSNENIMCI